MAPSAPPDHRFDRERVRGVVFDVDGTLYHQAPLRAIMAALLLVSAPADPKRLMRQMRVVRAYRCAQEMLRRPQADSEERVPGNIDLARRQILAAAGLCGEPPAMVAEAVRQWFYRRPLPLLPLVRRRRLIPTLAALAAEGYRLGVYSDYPARDKLDALGVGAYFPVVVTAGQSDIGAFKPAAVGFRVTARRMGISPRHLLYVGDRASVDGAGATCAGMQVVIIESIFTVASCRRYTRIRRFHHLLPLLQGLRPPSACGR